ncbi:uncharacterized protein BDZ99DRAFT_517257 [Mytilinidion resinicola]|uniref:Ankyrin n=1 Tax=Mytilinidion resinicola TaxID=574789 RepID=A0A6A6YVI6_9PEZI|nr:uncharacterized protein BDZ99DRAFT_517257 [Mytilinidion resinicola]KAF2812962.1 hypothetical protein BDZ99DRAFT_517257 [Mytilinidion resinicola]
MDSAKIRETCELLCKRRGVPSGDAKTRRSYISGICDTIQDENFSMPRTCIVSTESVAVAENSKEALKRISDEISTTAILAAAAQLGLLDVVIQVVEDMKETYSEYQIEDGSIFGQPLKNAAAQGHCNVVEFLLQNSVWDSKLGRRSQTFINTEEAGIYNRDMLDLEMQHYAPCASRDFYASLAPWKDATTGMPGREVFAQALALLEETRLYEDKVDEHGSIYDLCLGLKDEDVELSNIQKAEKITLALLSVPCSTSSNGTYPSVWVGCWEKTSRILLEGACRSGTPEMVKRRQLTIARQLLDHGVPIVAPEIKRGAPAPIARAVASEHIALFKLICERGVIPENSQERADMKFLAPYKKEDFILESIMEALQSTGVSTSKEASSKLRRAGPSKLLPDLYRAMSTLVQPCCSGGSALHGAYQGTPSTLGDWSEESSERGSSGSHAW